jgi:hypothetical protein
MQFTPALSRRFYGGNPGGFVIEADDKIFILQVITALNYGYEIDSDAYKIRFVSF